MPLCTPRIIGPITSWSDNLLIETALPGATVLVCEDAPDGRLVVKSQADGGRARLSLLPGVTLTPKTRLFAKQALDDDESAWTEETLASLVGIPPTRHDDISPLAIRSQLFVCGQAVWIEGAVPGAQVVFNQGSTSLGAGDANEGIARITLSRGLSDNEMGTAYQQAPNGVTPLLGSPATTKASVLPLPLLKDGHLPSPRFADPLPMGCDVACIISDAIDGARVILKDGADESALFDLSSLTYLLSKPLSADGGKLSLSQSVWPRCGYEPSEPVLIDFPPAQTPHKPLLSPPCGGSHFLLVDDVKPGASIVISVGSTVYKAQASTVGTSQTFELAAMTVGDAITVVQSACGLQSEPGETVVAEASASTPPVVEGPLYSCARIVRVSGVKPGALVCLYARSQDGNESMISPRVRALSDSIAIGVSPYLNEGQAIAAEQVACGGPPLRSEEWVGVEATPSLKTVTIAPCFSTQRFVSVDAVPGAWVIVREASERDEKVPQGRIIGTGYVDPKNNKIWLSRPLIEKERIVAEQHFCSLRQGGTPIEVGAGIKVFTMTSPERRPVTSEPDAEIVWSNGRLECGVDGHYVLSGDFKSTSEESYVDIAADVHLTTDFTFGTTINLMLAAANNPDDPFNQQLLANDILPEQSRARAGNFDAFKDSINWLSVLQAEAIFGMTVAINNLPSLQENQEGFLQPEFPSSD